MPNPILNPSFELDPALVNWTVTAGGADVSRSASFAYDGTYALRMINLTTLYSQHSITSDQFAVDGSKLYRSQIFHLTEDVAGGDPTRIKYFCFINWYDSTPSLLGLTWIVQFERNPSFDTWYRYETYLIKPLFGAVNAEVVIRMADDGPTGNYGFADLISLEEMSDDEETGNRITGNINTLVEVADARITGRILRRMIWSTTPTSEFDDEEARTCGQSPAIRVLVFHDSFPDNPIPGPSGQLKYIDVTDRLMTPGVIYREMTKGVGRPPSLVTSDMLLTFDDSDRYFNDRQEGSLFYGLDYAGWNQDRRVEVWAGFNYANVAEVLRKAKFSIKKLVPNAETGKAVMHLKDGVAKAYEEKIGVPSDETVDGLGRQVGTSRPLEYPRDVVDASNDKIVVRTDTAGPPAGWQNIFIPRGTWGKEKRAELLQLNLNEHGVYKAAGYSFAVTYDGENDQFIIILSGGALGLELDGAASTADPLYGFSNITHGGPGTYEIKSDLVPVTATETFKNVIEDLAVAQGGLGFDNLDIEDLALTFRNVALYNTNVGTAIQDIAEVGVGSLWTEGMDVLVFRAFGSMPTEVYRDFRGDTNRQDMDYIGQDTETQVREVQVTGRYGDVSVAESGGSVGQVVTIDSGIAETPAQVEAMATGYLAQYNLAPAGVELDIEYFPSCEPGKMVRIFDNAKPDDPILGHVVLNNLNLANKTGRIVVKPFSRVKVWATKEDWDAFDAESGNPLIVPTGTSELQLSLQDTAAAWREYVVDAGAGKTAKWLAFNKTDDDDSLLFFHDRFDTTPVGRYTVLPAEILYETLTGYLSYDAEEKQAVLATEYATTSVILLVNGISVADVKCEHEIMVTAVIGEGIIIGQLRRADADNFYITACRRAGESPRIGKMVATVRTGDLYKPDTESYYPLNTWLTVTQQIASSNLAYQVDPGIAEGTAQDTDLPAAGGVSQGIRGATAVMRAIRLSRFTSSPGTIAYSFWTAANPGGPWTPAASFAAAPDSRLLKTRVTISRATKYDSLGLADNMSVNYNIN